MDLVGQYSIYLDSRLYRCTNIIGFLYMDLVAGGSIISSQDILTQYILSRYINMCGGSLYAVANSLNQALGKHWKY